MCFKMICCLPVDFLGYSTWIWIESREMIAVGWQGKSLELIHPSNDLSIFNACPVPPDSLVSQHVWVSPCHPVRFVSTGLHLLFLVFEILARAHSPSNASVSSMGRKLARGPSSCNHKVIHNHSNFGPILTSRNPHLDHASFCASWIPPALSVFAHSYFGSGKILVEDVHELAACLVLRLSLTPSPACTLFWAKFRTFSDFSRLMDSLSCNDLWRDCMHAISVEWEVLAGRLLCIGMYITGAPIRCLFHVRWLFFTSTNSSSLIEITSFTEQWLGVLYHRFWFQEYLEPYHRCLIGAWVSSTYDPSLILCVLSTTCIVGQCQRSR